MELIKVLGLDWRILLAQLLNFSILLVVLYKFAYKPMFKFLDDRKDKIEKGIENAVRAEDRLKEISEKELEVLKKAKIEAVEILSKAKTETEEIRKRELTKTREEIGEIINQEKEDMRQEKAEILKSINREVADLVVATVEKVIEEKMSGAKDEELIKKSIAKLK